MTTDNNKKRHESPATYKTEIGSVTGQVHTGSGNIVIRSFTASNSITTKSEFLDALEAFQKEVESLRANGLPDETTDDVAVEIAAAKLEAKKDQPKADRIVKRLENIKAILVAGAGAATATTAAVAASSKLIPLVEKAIELAGRIF